MQSYALLQKFNIKMYYFIYFVDLEIPAPSTTSTTQPPYYATSSMKKNGIYNHITRRHHILSQSLSYEKFHKQTYQDKNMSKSIVNLL